MFGAVAELITLDLLISSLRSVSGARDMVRLILALEDIPLRSAMFQSFKFFWCTTWRPITALSVIATAKNFLGAANANCAAAVLYGASRSTAEVSISLLC
jgi:hypothetical protein